MLPSEGLYCRTGQHPEGLRRGGVTRGLKLGMYVHGYSSETRQMQVTLPGLTRATCRLPGRRVQACTVDGATCSCARKGIGRLGNRAWELEWVSRCRAGCGWGTGLHCYVGSLPWPWCPESETVAEGRAGRNVTGRPGGTRDCVVGGC